MYPFQLCKAILMGLCKQFREDGHLTAGACGFTAWNETVENLSDTYVNREAKCILAISEEAEAESEEEYNDVPHGDGKVCYTAAFGEKPIRDAMSGQVLERNLVMVARQKELKYFLAKEVWMKRPRSEAYRNTGKRPMSVKWVDVNKGDDLSPNYRSRLVARDIRLPGEQAIFAPTPPLEALRTVLSAAATDWKGARRKHVRSNDSEQRAQVSFIDVSRA